MYINTHMHIYTHAHPIYRGPDLSSKGFDGDGLGDDALIPHPHAQLLVGAEDRRGHGKDWLVGLVRVPFVLSDRHHRVGAVHHLRVCVRVCVCVCVYSSWCLSG